MAIAPKHKRVNYTGIKQPSLRDDIKIVENHLCISAGQGFGSFMIANLLAGLGYLCLVLSLLELTYAIPFPGKLA